MGPGPMLHMKKDAAPYKETTSLLVNLYVDLTSFELVIILQKILFFVNEANR